VGQTCEGVSRKLGRSGGDQQEVGQVCERVSRKWGRIVRSSARSEAGV